MNGTKEIAPSTGTMSTPIERALMQNDLSGLSSDQKLEYYRSVCESMKLNPVTQPFQYITLNNKLTLYVSKNATDQLRHIHKISLKITSRERVGDVYIVTAQAKTPDGREDESTGAVAVAKNAFGDNLANLYMKAETKAKRRVTLSICGLGFMDESEVETISGARPVTHEEVQSISVKAQPTEPTPLVKPVTQSEQKQPALQDPKSNKLATDAQRRMIWARCMTELQMQDEEAKKFLQDATDKASSKDWTMGDVDTIMRAIDNLKDDAQDDAFESFQ